MTDDEVKILLTAACTSLFTALVTEPIKASVQNRIRVRDLRRAIYWEISTNLGNLVEEFERSKNEDAAMRGLPTRFLKGRYRKTTYEFALKDSDRIHGLSYIELRLFEYVYYEFDSLNVALTYADTYTAEMISRDVEIIIRDILGQVKSGRLRERLMFRTSPGWFRNYLRETLPRVAYGGHLTNDEYFGSEPDFSARLVRFYDRSIKYRVWRIITSKEKQRKQKAAEALAKYSDRLTNT